MAGNIEKPPVRFHPPGFAAGGVLSLGWIFKNGAAPCPKQRTPRHETLGADLPAVSFLASAPLGHGFEHVVLIQ